MTLSRYLAALRARQPAPAPLPQPKPFELSEEQVRATDESSDWLQIAPANVQQLCQPRKAKR